jgi:hypothetical protein
MDTCLGDRDGLLFHGFVDCDLVLRVHLIELVNAADTMVSKHEGSGLDAELASLRVLQHTSRETSRRGGLTRGID